MAATEANVKRSGGRMAGSDRRKQIVQLASELFARKGFNGTTTKEIAEAAGVSEAIIFRHFATKSDLYAAIVDDRVQAIEAEFMPKLEAAMTRKEDRALFETLAFEILEFHRRDQTVLRLLLYSALEGHDLSRHWFKRYVIGLYDRFSVYFKERQADGIYREIEPKAALRAFIGMAINQSIAQYLLRDPILNLSNRKAAELFTDTFLNGILVSGRKR